jgi:hypothetical protein
MRQGHCRMRRGQCGLGGVLSVMDAGGGPAGDAAALEVGAVMQLLTLVLNWYCPCPAGVAAAAIAVVGGQLVYHAGKL